MRKVLALLLSLLMLTPALAEETVITPLPMGLTDTGYTPDPNAFIAADEENGVLQGYQDDSITVTLWRETVGDATYNVARVKIADPSQFRTGLNHPIPIVSSAIMRTKPASVARTIRRCRGHFWHSGRSSAKMTVTMAPPERESSSGRAARTRIASSAPRIPASGSTAPDSCPKKNERRQE